LRRWSDSVFTGQRQSPHPVSRVGLARDGPIARSDPQTSMIERPTVSASLPLGAGPALHAVGSNLRPVFPRRRPEAGSSYGYIPDISDLQAVCPQPQSLPPSVSPEGFLQKSLQYS
jgi:hypothetical protein